MRAAVEAETWRKALASASMVQAVLWFFGEGRIGGEGERVETLECFLSFPVAAVAASDNGALSTETERRPISKIKKSKTNSREQPHVREQRPRQRRELRTELRGDGAVELELRRRRS